MTMTTTSAALEPETRLEQTSAVLDGELVQEGDAVRIDGKRGLFRFRRLTVAGDASWITVFGGTINHERVCSFLPGRVHPARHQQAI